MPPVGYTENWLKGNETGNTKIEVLLAGLQHFCPEKSGSQQSPPARTVFSGQSSMGSSEFLCWRPGMCADASVS